MAKVYVSSTVLDLKAEREAVIHWLIAADHQPVHSYVADGETVRDSCLADIARCDLYLLILGHRYGYVPERDNPEGLSITQIEFRRAGELGLPRIALLRTSVPDIQLTDLLDPARNQRLQAFQSEVRQSVRPAEFKDEAELISTLSTGVQRALENRPTEAARATGAPTLSGGPQSTLPRPAATGSWWSTLPGILTGVAAVITALTGLAAVFLGRDKAAPELPPAAQVQAPAAALPASSPPVPVPGAQASTLPRVILAGLAEVRFETSTYTVLGVETQPRTPSAYGLRFQVRLLNRGKYPMNFWDSSFRLLIDGVPGAPDSNLNEVVAGNAAQAGTVSFLVANGARDLVLRIIQNQEQGEVADLPLRFVSAESVVKPATALRARQ